MATFDVLLPVKDGLPYLEASIASIQGQTWRDWRLLVLDHGSRDGSLELAQRYAEADARIQVHSLPHAVGLSGLLNHGIGLCDARYLLRQDADDLAEPARMSELHAAFNDDPELVLAGSLGSVIDGRGRRIGSIDMPVGSGAITAAAFFRIPVLHPSAAMRLDRFARLGACYGRDFLGLLPAAQQLTVPGLAEDYYLFGQLALVATCRNIKRPLIRFRWHDSNISKTRELAQLEVAVTVSRYLADCFSTLHGVGRFDPAPLSNHGMRLAEVSGQSDFSGHYQRMHDSLVAVLPNTLALRRELSFRHAISQRSAVLMTARYLRHVRRYGSRLHERNTVKAWLLRHLRRQPHLQLPPEPAA